MKAAVFAFGAILLMGFGIPTAHAHKTNISRISIPFVQYARSYFKGSRKFGYKLHQKQNFAEAYFYDAEGRLHALASNRSEVKSLLKNFPHNVPDGSVTGEPSLQAQLAIIKEATGETGSNIRPSSREGWNIFIVLSSYCPKHCEEITNLAKGVGEGASKPVNIVILDLGPVGGALPEGR